MHHHIFKKYMELGKIYKGLQLSSFGQPVMDFTKIFVLTGT